MTPDADRPKVGLALAGGGFRASFFHLGVFRRLAELDVLRRVEVLSTVSGGSIIGALYTLLLRERWLREDPGTRTFPERLTREDYLCIVDEMEATLRRGIQKNLRNRLLLNPLTLVRIGLTRYSFGTHMARVYERHLFADVVRRLRRHVVLSRDVPHRPGAFPLDQLRPVPGACTTDGRVDHVPGGIEDHNRRQAAAPDGCAILHHVINATSMNSGGRFWFSSAEVGDWYLGYVRNSEMAELTRLKALREALHGRSRDDLRDAMAELAERGVDATYREALVALWLTQAEARVAEGNRTGRVLDRSEPGDDRRWPGMLRREGVLSLVTTSLGQLRRAKLPAWYLQVGSRRPAPVWGLYRNPERTRTLFRAALAEIDGDLAAHLEPPAHAPADPVARRWDARRRAALESDLMYLVRTVYGLRSAAAVSHDVERDLNRLTVGDAVGASACFPPVFSPFMETGIYDDGHVQTLGLTDGGVFDNAGITGLLDEQCSLIIASDTGGVFDTEPATKADHLSLVGRLMLILQADLGSIQRSFVRERRRFNRDIERVEAMARDGGGSDELLDRLQTIRDARPLRGLAYFHIESDPPDPTRGAANAPQALRPAVAPHLLARIRTDLDAFGDAEIDALANHGYALADANVRAYLADFEADWAPAGGWAAPPAYPWARPTNADQRADLAHVLRVGGERFFRSVRVFKPASVVSMAVVLALLAGAALLAPDLARGVGEADAALRSLGTVQEWWGWTGPWPPWLRLTLAFALALYVIGRAYWRYRIKPSLAEKAARASGKAGKVLPRLLGFAVLAGLLLAWPGLRIWVAAWASLALVLPVVGLLDRLAFTGPFLRATRTIGRPEAGPLHCPPPPEAD